MRNLLVAYLIVAFVSPSFAADPRKATISQQQSKIAKEQAKAQKQAAGRQRAEQQRQQATTRQAEQRQRAVVGGGGFGTAPQNQFLDELVPGGNQNLAPNPAPIRNQASVPNQPVPPRRAVPPNQPLPPNQTAMDQEKQAQAMAALLLLGLGAAAAMSNGNGNGGGIFESPRAYDPTDAEQSELRREQNRRYWRERSESAAAAGNVDEARRYFEYSK